MLDISSNSSKFGELIKIKTFNEQPSESVYLIMLINVNLFGTLEVASYFLYVGV